MRRIQFILALLLVTILTVAGPCPACPAPQLEKSAHDCCPGGKTTKKAPANDDCPLIAYYLDVSKHGKNAQDVMLAEVPVSTFTVISPPARAAADDDLPVSLDNGRYAYLRHATLLL